MKKFAMTVTTILLSLPILATSVYAQPTEVTKPGWMPEDVGVMINSLLSLVLVIAALAVFGYLIWGGIEWITSGGDKSKIESARNKLTAAVVGLIVLAASFAILQLALWFVGVEDGITNIWDQVVPFDESTSEHE
jgi:hypothetical protein